MFRGSSYKTNIKYISDMLGYDYIYKTFYHKNDLLELRSDKLYIIVSGSISINSIYNKGNIINIATLLDGEIFSNINSNNSDNLLFMCNTDTEIVSISYNDLLLNINGIDEYRYNFIINIIHELISANMKLMKQISIISNKSTEKKLINYFKTNSKANVCTLSITYTDLADYLCVDRSSMMRTLSTMEKKGLIKKHGRRVIILSKK